MIFYPVQRTDTLLKQHAQPTADGFFLRNGVFLASASIDAHGRFIERA
jgi:hypothetical protein